MEKVVPRLMFISVTSHLVLRTYKFVLTLSVPGGGGGRESVCADFNFRELPCYLSNTFEMLPLRLKFIRKQDSGIFFLSK